MNKFIKPRKRATAGANAGYPMVAAPTTKPQGAIPAYSQCGLYAPHGAALNKAGN